MFFTRQVLCQITIVIFVFLVSPSQGQTPPPPVIGGEDAAIEEVPWQVGIFRLATGLQCGGAVIDAEWVLTAAHCFDGGFADPEDNVIYAGFDDVTELSSAQVRSVEAVYLHHDYVFGFDRDVALVKLSEPLNFNNKVQPIALATREDEEVGLMDEGVTGTVSGWGDTTGRGDFPNILQVLEAPVANFEDVNAFYGGRLSENMFGIGYSDRPDNTCSGDSGGPFVIDNAEKNEKLLAGVLSFGSEEGCGVPGTSSVFVKIHPLLDWIQKIQAGSPIADIEGPAYAEVGDTVWFFNTSYNGVSSFSWTVDDGVPVNIPQQNTIGFSPDQAGSIRIKLMVEGPNGKDTLEKELYVFDAPSVCAPTPSAVDLLEQERPSYSTFGELMNSYYNLGFYRTFFFDDPGAIREIKGVSLYFAEINLKSPSSASISFQLQGLKSDIHSETVDLTSYDGLTDTLIYFPFSSPVLFSDYLVKVNALWIDSYNRLEEVATYGQYTTTSNSGIYQFWNGFVDVFDFAQAGIDIDLSMQIHECIYERGVIAGTTPELHDVISIDIYPTISKGEFNVVAPEAGSLQVFSLTGEVLMTYELEKGASMLILTNFPEGNYFWRYSCTTGEEHGQIVLQK